VTDAEKFLKDLKQGKRFVVINDCYGGFGLSNRAKEEYKRLAGVSDPDFSERDVPRDDPYLIKVIKELGMAANGPHSNLKIVEIPGDVKWLVQDYDGAEWVAEEHRTWS